MTEMERSGIEVSRAFAVIRMLAFKNMKVHRQILFVVFLWDILCYTYMEFRRNGGIENAGNFTILWNTDNNVL